MKKIVPNRSESKVIAESLTEVDLRQMFLNAKDNIKNWQQVATVNKGMTKAAAFNILKHVKIPNGRNCYLLAVVNAVREFGEYLPAHVLNTIKRERKRQQPTYIHHEEPNFEGI